MSLRRATGCIDSRQRGRADHILARNGPGDAPREDAFERALGRDWARNASKRTPRQAPVVAAARAGFTFCNEYKKQNTSPGSANPLYERPERSGWKGFEPVRFCPAIR